MSQLAVNISVEAPDEYQVQEISYDGQEKYIHPLSMSENLTKLAHKIDFSKTEGEVDEIPPTEEGSEEDQKILAPFQPSLWPWDSVRTKLRAALTEVSVLLDVLNVAKEKRYLILDPVSQEPPESKPTVVMLAKKKALTEAGKIILNGAERLRSSQAEANRNRSMPDFHLELLRMRQSWRLKKVGNSILGDLSYRSAGSRYAYSSGIFEVVKNDAVQPSSTPSSPGGNPPPCTSALKIILPSELEGVSYIHVSIQKDNGTIASGELSVPLPQGAFAISESNWQKRLEYAQNVLFCKELFSRLAREAFQLQPAIPTLVVGNMITASLFPGVQLSIGLCHTTSKDKAKVEQAVQESQDAESEDKGVFAFPKPEHKHVLEHSLHQLLREVHYQALHHPMPRPTTAAFGVRKRRRRAGARAYDRGSLTSCYTSETLLEQIIRQTQHVVLRLWTMYMIDSYACEIKDPLIIAHWICLNGPTKSCVKLNIVTHGYETICRTSLVIHVGETTLNLVSRDGRVMPLSYEPQELRNLLMCLVSQHQMNGVQALAKLMGWKVLSMSSNVGVGPVEPVGTPSSVIMASPTGDRMVAVRCGPYSGIQVSVSSSPQQQDFYPTTLVRDRKWQHLPGAFREVLWEKMEGKSFLNKMEHLMSCLTMC